MGHKIKWIEENLGISRESVRHYKDKGLFIKCQDVGANCYEYSDEEIQRIWCIKLLLAIGYSTDEVKEILETPEFDFYDSISVNIEKLENMKQDLEQYIQFAETIKTTGRMPDVEKLGSTKFRDFINSAGGSWNLCSDSKMAKTADIVKKMAEGKEHMVAEELLENDAIWSNEEVIVAVNVGAYYRLLIELSNNDYKSETVQAVVKLLYKFLSENTELTQYKEKFTPRKFADHFAVTFVPGSDIAKLNLKEFGTEPSLFIANAIAYFGGYDSVNDIE